MGLCGFIIPMVFIFLCFCTSGWKVLSRPSSIVSPPKYNLWDIGKNEARVY